MIMLQIIHKSQTLIYEILQKRKQLFMFYYLMTEIHIINFGSLLVQQLYTALVETSRQEGGELNIRMNFILDEFANFTKISTFQSMLTVSRGRNIRFVICLQSFAQIEERYGKEGAQNIMDNCAWLYLKTSNIDTATKVSDKLRNIYNTSL